MYKIKLLLISHSNYFGGAELCFVETLKALYETKKYEIYAVLPKQNGLLKAQCEAYCYENYDMFLPFWIDNGIKFGVIEKLQRFYQLLVSSIKAFQLIKKINPNFVVTNTSIIPQFAIASKLSGTKHIWFIHELVEEDFGQHYAFGKILSKRLIGYLSNKVITNSHFVNNTYKSLVSDKKLIMLYQPVEIEFTENNLARKDNELKLLIVGKVADFKGQDQAVKATLKLVQSGANVRLTILGNMDGEFVTEVRNLIPFSYEKYFHFVSFVDKPAEYYKNSDIVLVCSKCEALGRVTIEAMKAGLSVVASDRGGNLELVKDGFNGYLYEYGNIFDLAEKIKLLNDSNQFFQLGKNGQKFAKENFNSQIFLNELIHLFEN